MKIGKRKKKQCGSAGTLLIWTAMMNIWRNVSVHCGVANNDIQSRPVGLKEDCKQHLALLVRLRANRVCRRPFHSEQLSVGFHKAGGESLVCVWNRSFVIDESDDLLFAFSSWLSGFSRFFAYNSAQMMRLTEFLAFSYLQECSTFGRETISRS